jgi:rubrerythrin
MGNVRGKVEVPKMEMNIIDRLQAALKDEQEAVEFYLKLADEVDNKGFYRRARLIRGIAADEQRHITILKDAIEELKTFSALIGATTPTGKTHWRVRLGSGGEIELFDTPEEAKKYVEERTGKYFSEAHWINPYGFELGPFVGPNFITFLEEDENGNPTERHTWGEFS